MTPSYAALIDGEAGAYGVVIPDLPGCTAMGTTIDDALSAAAEAMRDWMEVAGSGFQAPRSVDALQADPDVNEAITAGAMLVVSRRLAAGTL